MQENKQEKSLIKKNILIYLDKIGVTPYECYKKTGITRGILTQKNGITEDNIAKFLAYYTDVSIEWLITGRGKMTINPDGEVKKLVPYVDTVSEPLGISSKLFIAENEKLKSENQSLKIKNEELNEKLVKVQDSLLKLMAEKMGSEDLLETDKPPGDRRKNPRVKGFRGNLNDARVKMLINEILNNCHPLE